MVAYYAIGYFGIPELLLSATKENLNQYISRCISDLDLIRI